MARPKIYDDDLRHRLVDEAAAEIASNGVAALSLRRVAGAQGTSTNAVYTLFGSKDDLVDAVVEEARQGFTEAQQAVPRTDDAFTDLGGLGRAYRAWVLAHPALYVVLMGGRVGGREVLGGSGWTTDKTVQPLLAAVQRLLDEGRMVADSPEQVAVTLWAGVHGMVSLEVALWSDLPMVERDAMFEEHLYSLGCRWAV